MKRKRDEIVAGIYWLPGVGRKCIRSIADATDNCNARLRWYIKRIKTETDIKCSNRLSYLRPDGRWVGLEPTTTRLKGEVTAACNAALYHVVQTDKIENRLYGRPACWATLPDWWKGMESNHLFPACIAK